MFKVNNHQENIQNCSNHLVLAVSYRQTEWCGDSLAYTKSPREEEKTAADDSDQWREESVPRAHPQLRHCSLRRQNWQRGFTVKGREKTNTCSLVCLIVKIPVDLIPLPLPFPGIRWPEQMGPEHLYSFRVFKQPASNLHYVCHLPGQFFLQPKTYHILLQKCNNFQNCNNIASLCNRNETCSRRSRSQQIHLWHIWWPLRITTTKMWPIITAFTLLMWPSQLTFCCPHLL